MAKETAPPKAVNIVRPSHSFMPQKPGSRVSTSSSSASYVSAPPTYFQHYQQQQTHHSPSSHTTRKAPRVTSTTKVHDTVNPSHKPQLNIYHPPSPPQRSKTYNGSSSSSSNNNIVDNRRPPIASPAAVLPPSPPPPSSSRPHFEIYKPPTRAKTLAVPAGLVSQQHSPRRPPSVRNVVGPISKPLPESDPPSSVVSASSTSSNQEESPDELSDTDQDNDDDDDDEDDDEEEEEEVNEARVNRQIADLEISNQSLLAVNAMLEATVRKQASQVAKLKSQISGQEPIEPLPLPPVTEKSDLSDDEWEKDELFLRLFRMTETMIEQGQAALTFEFKAMGRVLSQYNQDDEDEEETEEEKKKEKGIISQ
ncbi:hypothetical protein BJV82DRAFT_577141 [Fennellomyces sp. T-0311]|nr:hypothetical protein BJV82DRAFT_577141 [Fennellomyces sp. T-0311]